ncbi:putative basic amino acid antiporter YfcC [Thalassotalea sp. LPB0316]|uniref:putative basic amino acid antiporter YfcC n=1 Tax=Thalassotalea sp. LPB0316 TaxID=2769490 RepID=UPI001867C38D|nr:putative basic amino acid antiporter YfcC [Thalassotalea sp. LPB0316]QOL27355.1 putative basic amino acid antiporter YfcC [Thalassotalea sp. LPB0316]
MPDALIILFFVVLVAAILTHVIPAGSFQMSVPSEGEKAMIIADSFRLQSTQGVPIFADSGGVGFFNFAFEGMVSGTKWGSAIGVMMFIIITGGAFGIVMKTGAVNNGILALINKTQKLDYLFIPLLFVMFSLGGAIFGMGEEAIAFCIVLLPLMRALGYDALTTVLVTYVATQIGFAASWMNPFSVAIAQGIADVPLLSGTPFRMTMWSVFTLVGVIFTVKHANQIKAQTSGTDQRQAEITLSAGEFSKVDAVILSIFALSIAWVIWGVVEKGYYLPEIASQFFAMGCVIAAVAVIGKRIVLNDAADAFKHGAQELLPAAMIVGMAKGIVILLGGDDPSQPSVLNTLLHYAGQTIGDFPSYVSALLMLVFQSVFNFFIASGSGQAALTMPLMAPLADLVGVTRQVAVLAFQLGDGLTNIIIPTSASLIGCLGVAKVDWVIWAKFIAKFMLVLIALAASFVVFAVMINFS